MALNQIWHNDYEWYIQKAVEGCSLGLKVLSWHFTGETQEEVNSRFNFRNACYNLVQNVIPFAFQKYEDENMENSNFVHALMLVWNLVSYTEGRAQVEGFWEQSYKEYIWA